MAFEPAAVSPLRIQKSNSTASSNSASSHYSSDMPAPALAPAQDDKRPQTPTFEASTMNPFQDVDSSEVGTPESVIHYSFEDANDESQGDPSIFDESSLMPEPSFVPRRLATIKAPDGGLKTRRSATVAELVALQDITTRSNESGPPVSATASALRDDDPETETATDAADENAPMTKLDRRQSFRMKLDMPTLSEHTGELSFGLNQEFERLLGASKRGYHMRENDKVVVASNRNVSNENKAPAATESKALPSKPNANGTRKPSGPLTKEPWNGRMRRHSTRRSAIAPERPMRQPTNATGLDTIEDASMLEDIENGMERGRFFVKVLSAKNLDIPLPKKGNVLFQLTLDNGLHCVTTNTLELGRNAPIGQEFELTVFDGLDFSLTLQTKLERPASKSSALSSRENVSSPSKSKSTKQSAFSRLMSSPKKRRKEQEMREEAEAQAAAQRQLELDSIRTNAEPSAWDLLHNLVGADGSFAQAVISLEDHEEKAFGRPYMVEVPCFNSWAAAEDLASSTKSKHGGVQRKPPYKIGSLSLQMIYVPRPRGTTDDEMPSSMSSAIKQMKEAESSMNQQHEGFLSQSGGDCPYWRRRYFKLNGSNLTAYHELTRQRRANINLAKADKLIDDRSALMSCTDDGKKRRKSAFASEDDGYMLVEEGFRVRFGNGEIIDFYAENRQQKDEWMVVLSQVIGRETSPQNVTWMNAVLAHERAKAAKLSRPAVPAKDPFPLKTKAKSSGTKSVGASPEKSARPQSALYEKRPASPSKLKEQPSPKRNSGTGLAQKKTATESSPSRRQAVKNMIF